MHRGASKAALRAVAPLGQQKSRPEDGFFALLAAHPFQTADFMKKPGRVT
jgi:hypothetical protein